jgi:hypothetical protein
MISFFLGGIALAVALRALWAVGVWIRFGFDTYRTRAYLQDEQARVEQARIDEMAARRRRNSWRL